LTDAPIGRSSPRRHAEQAEAMCGLRRDNDEFVITFQPEDCVAFRSHDAKALRKVCAFLRWKIVSDTSLTADDLN
jgi:hypothetical protein